jgi:hypothetical protein
MRRVTLGLAALGMLCFAAHQACAQSVVSRSTGIRMAAGPAVPGISSIASGVQFRQAAYYRHGYPGYRGHHRYYGGYGPALVPPRVWRQPGVVIPLPGYGAVVRPPVYAAPRYYSPYYYQPYRGFSYESPRFSFGFSF